jgi:hypothetical protein
MVAGGYTLSLSVCVLAVYSGIKRTPGTPLNTRRGSGEREAKSSAQPSNSKVEEGSD